MLLDALPGDDAARRVRQLMRTVTLHDASLLTINLAQGCGGARCFLSLQLAGGDRRSGVQFRYDMVKPWKGVLHEPIAGEAVLFDLYDEFHVSTNGTLTHST